MSSAQTLLAFRFLILLLAQVLIFSHINFLGYINPYIYILFVTLYPIKNNRILFLLFSFLLGITTDMFLDSGGIHAAAITTIAFIRPVVLKYSFGSLYDYQTIKFEKVAFTQLFTYVLILVVTHNLILFFLDYFNLSNIVLILKSTLFSSIFTIFLCLMLTIIFSRSTVK